MKSFRERVRKGAAVAAFLLLSCPAWGQVFESGLSRLLLPVAVSSSTYQSEIYLTTVRSLPVTATVQYLGGSDSATPGTLDCGTVEIPAREVVKKTIAELCPSLNAGNNFGSLLINTLGETGGTIPALRVYSRVQNNQGIGFSIEAYPPKAFSSDILSGPRIIGAKNGTDGNGIKYQTNCFVGVYPDASNTAQSMAILARDKFDSYKGKVSISILPGTLIRVLDVFNAIGISSSTYRDSYALEFTSADGTTFPSGAFGFCTVQNNNNFSADFRMPWQSQPVFQFGSDLNEYNVIDVKHFSISAGHTARYIGYVDGTGAFQCFVSDEQLRLTIRGFESMIGETASVTPRLEFSEAKRPSNYGSPGYYGYLDVEISPKQGVTGSITASVTCNVAHGIYGLLRLY